MGKDQNGATTRGRVETVPPNQTLESWSPYHYLTPYIALSAHHENQPL
mgnify:CR=1 FL=1